MKELEPLQGIGPHWVYRIYDPYTRELLYVGQTCDPDRRIRDHAKHSSWFPCESHWEATKVGAVDFEEHTSWDASLLAESWAIETENPLHNVERVTFERRLFWVMWRCRNAKSAIDFSSVRSAIQRERVS